MKENSDLFLSRFENVIKEKLFTSSLFSSLEKIQYRSKTTYSKILNRLNELKNVLDKIIAIVYHPAILVRHSRVVLRSEQAGQLSHESFEETMRDPKLWKEKNHVMIPEYVHSLETLDSIERYENAFISYLIDEIDKEIEETLSALSPFVESVEEHYQSKTASYGDFSFFHDLRKRNYPYRFFLVSEKEKKNEVLVLANKLKRKSRNLKGTEFYKLNRKNFVSSNVYPTNILIHDRLYSYCYQFYVKQAQKEEGKNISSFYCYCLISFLASLKECGLLKEENFPTLSFDEKNKIHFSPFSFSHYPFLFSVEEEKEYAISIKVEIEDEKGMKIDSSYHLLKFLEVYSSEQKRQVKSFKESSSKNFDTFTLVVRNNSAKEYDNILTIDERKGNSVDLFLDYLSSLTMLFYGSEEIYSRYCPMCGKTEVSFSGKEYVCHACGCHYKMFSLGEENLLYVKRFRKE